METTIQEELKFPSKPGFNLDLRKKSQPVMLISNYLKLNFSPPDSSNCVRQYALKFSPEVPADNGQIKRQILRYISKNLREFFHPYIPSGDTLFSPKFHNEKIELLSKFKFEDIDYEYMVSIEPTSNLIDLTSIKTNDNLSIKIKNLIEVLIKYILNANNGLVRFNQRNFFDYNSLYKLPGDDKAFVMPGWSTNVLITETGIFLRATLKSKFINGKTALEKLMELKGNNRGDRDYLKEIATFFEGSSVMTIYGDHKVYKLDKVVYDKTVTNVTIQIGDREITLKEYYKEQYQKDIRQLDQPLFMCFRKSAQGESAMYLVPELVYVCGMEEDMKNSESLKKTMVSKTKLSAGDRMSKIKEIKQLLYKEFSKKREKKNRSTGETYLLPSPNDIRQSWGLNIGDFSEVKGRILGHPNIVFLDQTATVNSSKFRCGKIKETVNLTANSWAIVVSKQYEDAKDSLIKSFNAASRNLGIMIDQPRIETVNSRNADSWVECLRNVNDPNRYKIIVIILDRNTKHHYGSIKSYISTEIGIPSQVVLKENLTKNLSYFSNVLNQMIVKMGGRLYEIEFFPPMRNEMWMIVGYDSVKGPSGTRKYVMTSTYDPNFSKIYTEELIVDQDIQVGPIGSLLRKSLAHFQSKANGNLPKKIVIYRSGVSDKEKNILLNYEVRSIKGLLSGELFKECYKENYTAQFAYITANKKCDAKFFDRSNNNLNNPKEGTVIDCFLTAPDTYEFYLQPQFVNSGTATPTHFQCLHDNTGTPLEIMEEITYRLSYYYWNWSGAIREPACLKFAESANKFSSQYVRDNVKDKLKDKPYYI